MVEDAVRNYSVTVGGYAVVNTFDKGKTSVSASVVWDDADNMDHIRPESVQIILSGAAGMTATLTEAGGWTTAFAGVPASGNYAVRVGTGGVITGADGEGTYAYEVLGNKESGFFVRLTHTPATQTLEGEIEWEDDSDIDGLRPDEVTIHLMAALSEEEEPVDLGSDYTKTVTKEDDWAWSFEDMPVYFQGQEIIYSLEEDPVEEYTTITEGLEVTNTRGLTPEFTTHSLLLSGEIGVNFFMDLPEQEDVDYSTSFMEFSISGRSARVVRETLDPEFQDVSGKGYYGFTVFMTANEMAQPITATFHYGNGQTVESTYSIKEYIIAYDEVQDRFDAATTALIHAIADYGHYVQQALSATNNWTIGVDYAEMDRYYTPSFNYDAVAAAVSRYNVERDTGDSDFTKITYSMNLLSRTRVYVYLYFDEGYSGKVEATTDGAAVEAYMQTNRCCVLTPDISAHNLNECHRIIVHTDSGTATVILSPMDYVKLKIGPDNKTADRDVVAAIYYYYLAAQNYRMSH